MSSTRPQISPKASKSLTDVGRILVPLQSVIFMHNVLKNHRNTGETQEKYVCIDHSGEADILSGIQSNFYEFFYVVKVNSTLFLPSR